MKVEEKGPIDPSVIDLAGSSTAASFEVIKSKASDLLILLEKLLVVIACNKYAR